VELRFPDSAANPYMTLAVCIAAGLEGIKNKLMAPDSVDKNIFALSDQEREALGIRRLPFNLQEAVKHLEKDDFVQSVLGEHISREYVEIKKKEWEDYCNQISQWELDQYLYRI
jgi:glutamine synthetase